MGAAIEPGMTTKELDAIGAKFLDGHGARSAPRLAYNFPGNTCISINEQAAHGVPGTQVIRAGDVVNIDVSAELDGYYGDTGGTFITPPASPLKQRLLGATREALANAINVATAGALVSGVGRAIERTARANGFRVIRNLCSHGIGRSLHEEPEMIPGYFDPRDKRRLWNGLVMTIEPFLSTKSTFAQEGRDGWTLNCAPGNLSAQFEHTMIITRGKPMVLTALL
jgi:methionyl aminopeptidase